MARKKLTPIQKAYRAQVSRIKKIYRSLVKEGYRFEKDLEKLFPKLNVKRPTKRTIEALKEIKPITLRKRSTALSESGKVISGQEAYKERKKLKNKEKERPSYLPPINPAFIKKRKLQDQLDLLRAQQFKQADIIYGNIRELIDRFPTKGSQLLNNLLAYQISKYGLDKVTLTFATMPEEAITQAQNIIYYEQNAAEMHQALSKLAEIITGEVMSPTLSKEIGEILDELDSYDDVEP